MSKTKLDKSYNWDKLEDHWYQHWLANGYFKGDSKSDKEPYSIVIPPPNVTGMLTMGHVLNNTCLLYTSPSPRDRSLSRMPSSA